MSLRIDRLDFKPWGCFEDLSLTFGAMPGVVDLVEGSNAAGKSTTSRGECALLYGIAVRTPDGHTFDYGDLRIGALLDVDGADLEVVRRKARAGTLLAPDGRPLAQDPIPAALGGMTEEVYRALFQVDHDTLVKGGEELLQGRGEVGASLFAAAAGIVTLHDTLAALDAEADCIFKPRGHATKLHRELANLRDAERRLRQAMVRPATHRKMESVVEQAQEACEEISRQIREMEGCARGVERRRATAPLFDDHSALSVELDDLSAVPDLAHDATEQRIGVQTAIRTSGNELERSRKTMKTLERQMSAIEIDENLIERAAEIRAVHDDISVITKAASNRRKREGELQEAQGQLRAAAATIGVNPEEIAQLRRPDTARRALDRFLRRHDEIAERRRLAQERVEEAKRQRDDDKELLAEQLPTPSLDVRALEAAVRSASLAGDLPSRLAATRAETERLVDAADTALTRLHPVPENVGALCRLSTPSRDTIRRLTSEHAELRQLDGALDAELLALDEDERELNQEREHLRLEGDAPTAEDLAELRAARGGHWVKLRGAIDAGAVVLPGLPDAFEEAVAHSDRVADGLARDAAKVARAANIRARALRLELDHGALERRAQALEARRATNNVRWAEAWARTGLSPISAEEALTWMDSYDEIVQLAADSRVSSSSEHALTEQILTHAGALRRCMEDLKIPLADGLGLDELQSQAEIQIVEVRERATQRATLSAALAGSERELTSAEHELRKTEDDWADWEAAWPTRRQQGGLPACADPETAHELVRAVEEALAQIARIGDLDRKIEGIDRDYATFGEVIEGLCAIIAPDLAGLEPSRAAATLMTRLGEAEAKWTERASLSAQLGTARTELDRLDAEVADARSHLDELLHAADCTDIAELADVERRAARRCGLRDEAAKLERQISQVGEGVFEDLRSDANEFDRDAADGEVRGLRERIEELGVERDELKEQIGQGKRELEIAEGNISAVAAAEDIELAQARIRELAGDCAKAKLAAAVIRRAIERYRSLHQDPLLLRANELFTRFTYGDYKELFVDVNEKGVAYMVARRHDRVRHDMSQMSTGTREQLFLALRLAAIERYVELSGPVPVIFDDVFLESDEPRSERIFEALGELAMKTQVIVLTHHHHLVAVGKCALGDRLRVQDLPAPRAAMRPAVAA
jgi:uncharacterized protein YhaN